MYDDSKTTKSDQQNLWIPERGFIVGFREELNYLNRHPIIQEYATTVQAKQILSHLFVSDDHFDLADFVNDMSIDLNLAFAPIQAIDLEDFIEDLREDLIDKLQAVVGEGFNIPTFHTWIGRSDAIFHSMEGHFTSARAYRAVRTAQAFSRSLGLNHRPVSVSLDPKRHSL